MPLVYEGHHDLVAVVSELQIVFAPLQLTKSEIECKDMAVELFRFVNDFVSNEPIILQSAYWCSEKHVS